VHAKQTFFMAPATGPKSRLWERHLTSCKRSKRTDFHGRDPETAEFCRSKRQASCGVKKAVLRDRHISETPRFAVPDKLFKRLNYWIGV